MGDVSRFTSVMIDQPNPCFPQGTVGEGGSVRVWYVVWTYVSRLKTS